MLVVGYYGVFLIKGTWGPLPRYNTNRIHKVASVGGTLVTILMMLREQSEAEVLLLRSVRLLMSLMMLMTWLITLMRVRLEFCLL